ncbi:MAG: DUF192 domain-containing protein [Rhizonema sp. NSF051]|nr:DUF192 domain-containing protein [Rhizonema sp. NSF051]
MNCRLSLLSIVLGILLMSCSTPTPAVPSQTQTSVNMDQMLTATNAGQQLPISAQAIVPNGTKIQLEVARTSQQQALGLMYRPALPDDRGMLFPFSPPETVGFWMKNVPVALDMVFLRNGIVEYVAASVPGCKRDPCPSYGPKKPFDMVIELRSGRAAELGLKVSTPIKIEYLNSNPSRS